MNRYWTGLIPTSWQGYPSTPYKGRGWAIDHQPSLDARCVCVYKDENGLHKNSDEVIIITNKTENARKCADLIRAAIVIIDTFSIAEMFGFPTNTCIYTKEDWRNNHADPLWSAQNMSQSSSEAIVPACLLASRASFRTGHIVAIHKLSHSYWNVAVPPIDLDPFHSENIRRINDPKQMVAYTTAIILAYSAIEEMGLEIRASKEKPSHKDGAWTPCILDELKARLRKNRIDPNQTVLWHLRGGRSRIEKAKPVDKFGVRSFPQAFVRDREIPMFEAIHLASYLRSQVSAHPKKLRKSLSIYDVVNVQSLARLLLLLRFKIIPFPEIP